MEQTRTRFMNFRPALSARHATWVALGLLSAALAAAQGIVFEDKDRNMTVRSLTSWNAERVNEDRIQFRGAGRPFEGSWRDQGLRVRAQRIEGLAQRNDRGAFALREATITGDVSAELTGDANGDPRKTTLAGPKVVYGAASREPTATVLGPMKVVSTVEAQGQRFELRGASAKINLAPADAKADFPILRARVEGPVVFVLAARREVTESGKIAERAVKIDGTAGLALYDDVARTLTLSGGVSVQGDDTAVGGRASASKAVIHLDAERKVKSIDLEGDPGESAYRDRGAKR